MVGQVEVYNRKVKFEAQKTGEHDKGWVAIDNINVEATEGNCETIPQEAQISTVLPETTTTEKPKG